MNKSCQLAILALVVVCACSQSGFASLVAHWKLDEPAGTSGTGSIIDSGPIGFNGTPSGTITYAQAGANAATGTSFGYAGGGAVSVPYDGMLNPASFTVTAWAYLSSAGAGHRSVITSRDDQGGNSDGYILYATPANTWEFWTGDGAQTGNNWLALGGGLAATNAWTHLAISYDAQSKTKSIYVNGSLANSAVQGYEPSATGDGLHIGGGADNGASYRFNGRIDDVTLWNQPLPLSAIQEIMASSAPAQHARLVASFDVGTEPAFTGVGPFGGPATPAGTFVKINSGSPTAGPEGLTAQVFNGLGFSTPNSPGSELTDDYVYESAPAARDGVGEWRITGLMPGHLYDIYIAAPDGTGFGATNVYGGRYRMTVGGADQLDAIATGGTTETFFDFVDGRDYAVFTNVQPDSNGVVAGTYNYIPGQNHTGIAGFQIVEVGVPEPATMALLSLAAAGLGGYVRRRRRA